MHWLNVTVPADTYVKPQGWMLFGPMMVEDQVPLHGRASAVFRNLLENE